ncbi:MAG: DUF4399 domain-containing protein [Longimicrobiales bacterium]
MRQRKKSRSAGARTIGALAMSLSALAYGCGSTDQANDAATTDASKAAGAPPRVVILEPEDGAEVTGTSVLIVLSAENIEIAPAGDTRPGTGHHHLFVNAPVIPAAGEAIPAGVAGIIHLGQAQTSYELTNLSPGEYSVISVVGDLAHRRVDPQVLDTVRFRVR